MRASISKPIPFIYSAFEKNRPIHTLPFFVPIDGSSKFIIYQEARSIEKSLSEKYVHVTGCQIRKIESYIYFLLRKGAALKKGRKARTTVLCHIQQVTPLLPRPLPPLPHPQLHPRRRFIALNDFRFFFYMSRFTCSK